MGVRGVDLFSGAGGLTLGFKRAGIEPICAVEVRRDAAETFASHSPEVDHFCDDIRNVDLSKYRGKADLVYGGPPCQPFSTGGLRNGTQDKRNMIPAFLEAVETVQPAAVVMENVPGLATKARIHYVYEILAKLTSLGFVPNWRIVNSSHYGVPQKRRRLFIVALRDRAFWFPRASHGDDGKRPVVPTKAVIKFEPDGEPPDCPVKYAKYPDIRPSPYAGHVYNGGGRPIDMEAPCHTILASAGGYKTHWVDTQGIAPKYREHLASGGEPWEGSVPGARRLTVEECAAIQTFPKRLKFFGSRNKRYTQVGDAVPPRLGAVIGRALVKQMGGQEPVERSHYPPDATQYNLI